MDTPEAPIATAPSSAAPTPLDIARKREERARVEPKEGMFTPEQQAEVDRIIRDRIQRVEAKYAAIDVPAAEQRMNELEQQIRDGELKVMRNNLAARFGLSPEDRDLLLTGSDASTLETQASLLAQRGFGRPPGNVAPREGRTVEASSDANDDVRAFIDNLFGSSDW